MYEPQIGPDSAIMNAVKLIKHNLGAKSMKLNTRQKQLLQALADAGATSPLSRQDLVDACDASGAYACPPSWLTQDSTRKVGRGLYDCPELVEFVGGETIAPDVAPAPVTVATAPAPQPVQGAVATVDPVASLVMGMTGGDRQTLVPKRFNGYVKWGHYNDIKKIVKSGRNLNVFVTGLSGNGKTLMVEQICADLKRECFRVNLTRQTDEDDLLGGFRLINGNTVWQDGPVTTALKQGGVLLLDEVDLASHNIMCLQPVLEGKGVYLKKIGEWVTPAEGFVVIATANTKGRGDESGKFAGTGILNEAFLERFPFTYEQPYATRATERKILTKAGLQDEDFADNLTKWAEIIRKTYQEGGIDDVISTRRLVNIVEAYEIFENKRKALTLCLARFDEDTKETFIKLYEKVDADVRDSEESTDGESTQGNECPF
jgi:MoxR-like ATPase